jgi:hypothetical protein
MIVGVCGLIGSGKNTATDYLEQYYGFKRMSFADSLKDAISVIFGWDREMLAGLTAESRNKREIIDTWWANRLNIPNLTPRWVLQQWGTEVCRHCFHEDIWLASLERKLEGFTANIVIDDCRFKNEMKSIKKYGGSLVKINRGSLPDWYDTALSELKYLETYEYETGFESKMTAIYPDVHISEWGWVAETFDYEIENNGPLEELHLKLDDFVQKLQ